MWKALLLLLALGVVFVVLLRVLERWGAQAKIAARPRRALSDEESEEPRTGEEEIEERIEELVAELAGGDADAARDAAAKLLMIGPRVIERMMPELLRAEQGRRRHEEAVIARRLEDTLVSFGPVVIRPCLELMAAEKGSFEVFQGVRAVVTGIGDAAARPLVELLPWLSDEGLYARALLLVKSLGPPALSAILRVIEGGDGRLRELAADLLLDLARCFPAALRERVRDAFGAARRGVGSSPEVRLSLVAALRRTGPTEGDADLLRPALDDPDPRIRREAWLAVAEGGSASFAAGHPFDADPVVAAAQCYAFAAFGRDLPGDERGGTVAVARLGVRARLGEASALNALESALLEGPLESRREAAEALAHAGGEEAGRILARGLAQTPVPILGVVASALGRTRAAAGVPVLFDLWEERGGNAVRRAIARLGPQAVPKLMDYVSRRNPRLMEPAALVLGELGGEARAPLLEFVRECRARDPALFAAEIALELQGNEAVDDLVRLLGAGEPHLLELAACVLSRIGDPRATEPLLSALDRVEDRAPILDFVRRGPPEVHEAARRFVEAHPAHPDAEALRQAAG